MSDDVTRDDLRRASKTMSWALRHAPDEAGIALDADGWADVDALLSAVAARTGVRLTRLHLEAMVRPNPDNPAKKVRFQLDGDRIRAGHGHSIEVDGHAEVTPPGDLLHATRREVLEVIRAEGLNSMGRQMVHLSHDREMMVEAARRQGGDIVLVHVDVERAKAGGVVFYQGADARVFLARELPPAYLRFTELDDRPC